MGAMSINVKVVGCGGIGGELLPTLCRFLNYSSDLFGEVRVTLIDGDAYEPRNADRQEFEEPGNKATVKATSLGRQFPRISFASRAEYVTRRNVAEVVCEGDVVFSCVDNHATRLLLSDRCCELRRVTLISGGNDYTQGNIQVHVREDGVDLTLPIANDEYHPEILRPTDENPGDASPVPGCESLAPNSPQLLFANCNAATLMKNCFYAWVHKKLAYDEVYFDLETNRVLPVKRRKETVPA